MKFNEYVEKYFIEEWEYSQHENLKITIPKDHNRKKDISFIGRIMRTEKALNIESYIITYKGETLICVADYTTSFKNIEVEIQ